jgi:hypothetical protein
MSEGDLKKRFSIYAPVIACIERTPWQKPVAT